MAKHQEGATFEQGRKSDPAVKEEIRKNLNACGGRIEAESIQRLKEVLAPSSDISMTTFKCALGSHVKEGTLGRHRRTVQHRDDDDRPVTIWIPGTSNVIHQNTSIRPYAV